LESAAEGSRALANAASSVTPDRTFSLKDLLCTTVAARSRRLGCPRAATNKIIAANADSVGRLVTAAARTSNSG